MEALTGQDAAHLIIATQSTGRIWYSTDGTTWAISPFLSQAGNVMGHPVIFDSGSGPGDQYMVNNCDTGNSWRKTTISAGTWTGIGRPSPSPGVNDMKYGPHATIVFNSRYYFIDRLYTRVFYRIPGAVPTWSGVDADMPGDWAPAKQRGGFADLDGTLYAVAEAYKGSQPYYYSFLYRRVADGNWSADYSVTGTTEGDTFLDILAGPEFTDMNRRVNRIRKPADVHGGLHTREWELMTPDDIIRYVDTAGGDDKNDGSSASPWKTITHALQEGAWYPSDYYILIKAGTYEETLDVQPRQSGRTFLIGQPSAVSHSGTTNGYDTTSEPSGLHRIKATTGTFVGNVTVGQFIAVEVSAGGSTAWEVMTILAVGNDGSDDYVTVGGDGGDGKVYPVINGTTATSTSFVGRQFYVYDPAVIVQPSATDPAIPLSVSGSTQLEVNETNEVFDQMTTAAAWIRFDSQNATAQGVAIEVTGGARFAADLCQTYGQTTTKVGAALFLGDRSTIVSGPFFNGAEDGNDATFPFKIGVPSEVETWTQAPSHITIYANPATGCNYTSRKGIGDVGAAVAGAFGMVALQGANYLLDGCYLKKLGINDLSIFVQNGLVRGNTRFGLVADGGVQLGSVHGQAFNRLKCDWLAVTDGCAVSTEDDVEITPGLASGAAFSIQRGSSVGVSGTLTATVSASGATYDVAVVDQSRLYVKNDLNITHTAGGTADSVYLQAQGRLDVEGNTDIETNTDSASASNLSAEDESGAWFGGTLTLERNGDSADGTAMYAVRKSKIVVIGALTLDLEGPTGGSAAFIEAEYESEIVVASTTTYNVQQTATGEMIEAYRGCKIDLNDIAISITGTASVWANGETKIFIRERSEFQWSGTISGVSTALSYGSNGFLRVSVLSEVRAGTFSYYGTVLIEADSSAYFSGLTIPDMADDLEGLLVDGNSRASIGTLNLTRSASPCTHSLCKFSNGSRGYLDGVTLVHSSSTALPAVLEVMEDSQVTVGQGLTVTYSGTASTDAVVVRDQSELQIGETVSITSSAHDANNDIFALKVVNNSRFRAGASASAHTLTVSGTNSSGLVLVDAVSVVDFIGASLTATANLSAQGNFGIIVRQGSVFSGYFEGIVSVGNTGASGSIRAFSARDASQIIILTNATPGDLNILCNSADGPVIDVAFKSLFQFSHEGTGKIRLRVKNSGPITSSAMRAEDESSLIIESFDLLLRYGGGNTSITGSVLTISRGSKGIFQKYEYVSGATGGTDLGARPTVLVEEGSQLHIAGGTYALNSDANTNVLLGLLVQDASEAFLPGWLSNPTQHQGIAGTGGSTDYRLGGLSGQQNYNAPETKNDLSVTGASQLCYMKNQ
jgi:hypothetical protein